MATTYTVTNDFTAGTTAVADDVDQNFSDILTAINAFDASNLASGSVPVARISGLTPTQFAATAVVTEGEGINSSDNDTSFPTSAAVNDHLENHIGTGAFNPTSMASDTVSVTFPNGMIMKWGTDTIGSTTTKEIEFATAFTTGCYHVNITETGGLSTNLSTHGPIGVYTLSASSFYVENDNGAARSFRWFAIGY